MAAEDKPNYDPGISYAQRQDLYHRTGDRYWLDNENITKEMAGKQYALLRGKKKVENKMFELQKCQCLVETDKNLLISALAEFKASYEKDIKRYYGWFGEKDQTLYQDLASYHNKVITHIDKLLDEISNTPNCEG